MADTGELAGTRTAAEATPIFRPDPATVAGSQLSDFVGFCEREMRRRFADHAAFERFSIAEYPTFWSLFLRWSALPFAGNADPVSVGRTCEDATFFPNLRLNYCEALLADEAADDDRPALTACHRGGGRERLTRRDLRERALRLAGLLRRLGVGRGDRVAAIARNGGEAIVAALATAALGATFSSCAPDMGPFAILTRFAPLRPVALMAGLRAEPWDVGTPLAERIAEVAAGLPSLRAVVALDDAPAPAALEPLLHRLAGKETAEASVVGWERFPFNQPLFILFSSGTTGQPKCIVHGAGGTLLEHVKEHRLHCDLRCGEKLFFQTSCAWMMWNWQLSALASGVELVTYDGPVEGPETLWRIVAGERVSAFGTSPAYLQFCEDAGYEPCRDCDLSALRVVFSTGSILYDRQYDWVRDHVKAKMPLQSISGGTDIIGCFVLGNPNLPVHRGEAQCRSLAMDVRALPAPDRPEAAIGELVCANPFPSRPLGFHGDADGSRFHAAYFGQNPGVWTHGDLIEFTATGGARLHGRSDGVLNIRGIRIGPAEIYRILQDVPEIVEAMAVEQRAEDEPGGARLVLLVVLRPGKTLGAGLANHIRSELARRGSSALVPTRILDVAELPTTHSGKRSEAAARDAVNRRAARNRDALRNPDCLAAVADHPGLQASYPLPIAEAAKPPAPAPQGRSAWTGVAAWLAGRDGPAPATDRRQARPTLDRGLAPRDELERKLQLIYETVLGLSPVGRCDNFFELGGNSLAVLRLRAEIRTRLRTDIPLLALFQRPTVASLATMLRAGAAAMEPMPSSHASARPTVRPAGPGDVERLCHFLHDEFDARIDVASWRRIFDYAWLAEKPDLGVVLTLGDDIVGFLGTVYSDRRVNGRTVRVCNCTTWYIRPAYRGWGLALLEAALSDKTLTYTSLTPSATAAEIFKGLTFRCLDRGKILLPPLLHLATLRAPRPEIVVAPDAVCRLLDDEQRRIFDDHKPYGCLQLLLREGTRKAYLVTKRRTKRGLGVSELLHCSAPELLVRHLERVKLTIMREQRTVALLSDARLLPKPGPLGLPIKRSMLFRSTEPDGALFDNLYSELVLLPL